MQAQAARPSESFFTPSDPLRLRQPLPDWDIALGDGPVVTTAIHDGHLVRDSLRPHLAIEDEVRRREEDPLTSLFTTVGDVRIRARHSRFQVDLNRPRELAMSTDPQDTWGLKVWHDTLPEAEREISLASHDAFYAMVAELLERLIERWGCVLLIDLHSYNHRRDGADAQPAPQQGNPDIELGVTTLDSSRWGATAARFADALRACPVAGSTPDVRENVRFPTGGHFPEWVYATYGDRVCTISPEYKKIYMDEWTAQADIAALEDLRDGLQRAVDAVRPEFMACR
jgi:N-formylglutamate amidohydrolase